MQKKKKYVLYVVILFVCGGWMQSLFVSQWLRVAPVYHPIKLSFTNAPWIQHSSYNPPFVGHTALCFIYIITVVAAHEQQQQQMKIRILRTRTTETVHLSDLLHFYMLSH